MNELTGQGGRAYGSKFNLGCRRQYLWEGWPSDHQEVDCSHPHLQNIRLQLPHIISRASTPLIEMRKSRNSNLLS